MCVCAWKVYLTYFELSVNDHQVNLYIIRYFKWNFSHRLEVENITSSRWCLGGESFLGNCQSAEIEIICHTGTQDVRAFQTSQGMSVACIDIFKSHSNIDHRIDALQQMLWVKVLEVFPQSSVSLKLWLPYIMLYKGGQHQSCVNTHPPLSTYYWHLLNSCQWIETLLIVVSLLQLDRPTITEWLQFE